MWKQLLWLIAVLASSPANAQSIEPQLQYRTEAIVTHVEGILRQTQGLMARAGDMLRNNSNSNAAVMQGSLRSYLNEVNGPRALLFVDANGDLALDTTKFPAATLNLRSRDYFSQALTAKHERLVVSAPVTGAQSGVPFVPLSHKVNTVYGDPLGVLVAVVTPDALIPDRPPCAFCFVAIFTDDGALLATSPAQAQIPDNFFTSLKITRDKDGGNANTMLNIYPTKTVWRRVRGFPVVVANSMVTR